MKMSSNLTMWFPIVMIVVANVAYAICAKHTPGDVHPLATLSVTYFVGMVICIVAYFIMKPGGSLTTEFHHLNWTSYVLGIAIAFLEFGSIWMYKAGWQVNTGFLCHSTLVVVALVFVGYFFYHEGFTWAKAMGVLCCLGGLYLINR